MAKKTRLVAMMDASILDSAHVTESAMEYILRLLIEFSIVNSARTVLLAYDLTPVSSARSKKPARNSNQVVFHLFKNAV